MMLIGSSRDSLEPAAGSADRIPRDAGRVDGLDVPQGLVQRVELTPPI